MENRIKNASEFGALLKKRRKELGYTQIETASLCGTGTRFISDLENGKETVELGKALGIAASLGLNIWIKERV